MAGFTGTRCSWTVFPAELTANGKSLQKLWARRQATKFNGVPYVIQRAAEAALSPEGFKEAKENIKYYMDNAKLIAELLREKGIWFSGGVCSPYIWLKCPDGMDSWSFFDWLLENAQAVSYTHLDVYKRQAIYLKAAMFVRTAVLILYYIIKPGLYPTGFITRD